MILLRHVVKFMLVVGSVMLPETQAAEHAESLIQVRSPAGILNSSASEQRSELQLGSLPVPREFCEHWLGLVQEILV